AFARFEREVQAVERGVALLEDVHYAQALQVVLKAAVRPHAGVQRILPGVAEWGVAEVVGERDRFGQILVEIQSARDRTRELRHLQAVGQAGAEKVPLVVDEYLGLVFEAAEGGGVDDAIAIALVFAPAARRGLAVAAPARVLGARRVRGEFALRHA